MKVAELGSFTLAASALERSTSYVSKEITKLEQRLNIRLFNRSTRTLRLTDEGQLYFERARLIVHEMDDLEQSLGEKQTEAKGLIKMSVPTVFGEKYLGPVIHKFMEKHKGITVDMELNDRFVDVIAEGLDVVVRATNLKDSNLIAQKLMTSRMLTVASPDYLAKIGTPKTPQDLLEHKCLTYSLKQSPTYWEYFNEDGKAIGVKVASTLQTNAASVHITAAKNGVGVLRIPEFICKKELAEGSLVPILESYEPSAIVVAAVYPHRRFLNEKTRIFVEFLKEEFK